MEIRAFGDTHRVIKSQESLEEVLGVMMMDGDFHAVERVWTLRNTSLGRELDIGVYIAGTDIIGWIILPGSIILTSEAFVEDG